MNVRFLPTLVQVSVLGMALKANPAAADTFNVTSKWDEDGNIQMPPEYGKIRPLYAPFRENDLPERTDLHAIFEEGYPTTTFEMGANVAVVNSVFDTDDDFKNGYVTTKFTMEKKTHPKDGSDLAGQEVLAVGIEAECHPGENVKKYNICLDAMADFALDRLSLLPTDPYMQYFNELRVGLLPSAAELTPVFEENISVATATAEKLEGQTQLQANEKALAKAKDEKAGLAKELEALKSKKPEEPKKIVKNEWTGGEKGIAIGAGVGGMILGLLLCWLVMRRN
jgi:hypothetical protein